MSNEQEILATFVGGVFKLDTPLDLPDGTRRRIVVELLEDDVQPKDEAFLKSMQAWREARAFRPDGAPPSRDNLHQRGE